MRYFASTIEHQWNEQLLSANENGEIIIGVDELQAEELNSLYSTIKPSLEESDTYSFIAMDVTQEGSSFWGILNCRVNGEHIQVRF